MVMLSRGIVETSLSGAPSGAVNGTTLSLPASQTNLGISLAWQMVYTGTVTGVQMDLQLSMDNINWTSADSSTSTSGCYRIIIPITARFVRISQVSRSGGDSVSGKILIN